MLGFASVLPFCSKQQSPRTESSPDASFPQRVVSVRRQGSRTPKPRADPFASADRCRAALAAGQRLERPGNRIRVGTWNIRWFPDGVPGRRADPAKATDIDWLACAVAWLQVDVLALQEIRTHRRARRAAARLLQRLKTLTGRVWDLRLDTCRGPLRRHTGILWNTGRVSGARLRNISEINPLGSACAGIHPPGLGGLFRSKPPGTGRFHFIALHLEPGTDRRSYRRRQKTWRSIPSVALAARRLARAGVIIAGDWNTDGCEACKPPVTPNDEFANSLRLMNGIQKNAPPFRRPTPTLGCSWYRQNTRKLLDHVLVSAGLRLVPKTARTRVSGYCEAARCGPLPRTPAAFDHLSDHCPVVLDLVDRGRPKGNIPAPRR